MKRGFTALELVIVGLIVLILAAILFPAFARTDGGEGGRVRCQDNLRTQVLALTQYTKDYNDHYPVAASCNGPTGWAVMLQPYLRTAEVFKCPSGLELKEQRARRDEGYTDYWINGRLFGAVTRQVSQPAKALAFGEGNDGTERTDPGYSLTALPTSWIANERSPLHRHLRGSNYAFADGHVAWLSADSSKSSLRIDKNLFEPRAATK